MRKRTLLLLFLPIVLIVWTIGWTFMWTANQQQTRAHKHQQEDSIRITVQLPEQPEQEIAD